MILDPGQTEETIGFTTMFNILFIYFFFSLHDFLTSESTPTIIIVLIFGTKVYLGSTYFSNTAQKFTKKNIYIFKNGKNTISPKFVIFLLSAYRK